MREARRRRRPISLPLLSRNWLPKSWRLRIPVQVSRENILLLVVAVATVWMSWALAQEIGLRAQMNAQAAQMRQQNAQLAAQNHSARQDAQNVQSGGWNEQEARMQGYTRPGEKVYIVAAPPSPQSVPAPPRKQAANPFQRFWDWLTGSPSA
ncbi:MAG: septum formation initiator family protein [Candidatus Dormibacteraeota bacterium]|nr:septum formation initiator family protein [Candidatus Dormibacteraeota bacterium]MBO0745719.1 septum formation initiator family protein [Candidatus Dormibacteraeota bacterium]